jgi:hypothetical protein
MGGVTDGGTFSVIGVTVEINLKKVRWNGYVARNGKMMNPY